MRLLAFFLIICCNYSLYADALSIYRFGAYNNSLSNYGLTGILQMPSARIGQEGKLALSYSKWEPYSKLTFYAAPFSWLEANYQYTDLENRLYSSVFEFSGNQTAKDKGFSVKIRLIKESNFLPQISIGLRDLGGTGLFSAEYLVASKRLWNIDLTSGISWGSLSRKKYRNPLSQLSSSFERRTSTTEFGGEFNFNNLFSDRADLFLGAEFFIPYIRNISFKYEYDTTDYLLEAQTTGNPFIGKKIFLPDSRHNFGLNYSFSRNLDLSLGFIKGNTLSASFTFKFDANQTAPFIKRQKQEVKVNNSDLFKAASTQEDRYFYLASLRFLRENNISLKTFHVEDNKVALSFSQNSFSSYPESYGVIMDVMEKIAPDSIDYVTLISRNSAFELSKVTIPLKQYSYLKNVKDHNTLIYSSNLEGTYDSGSIHNFKPTISYPAFFGDIYLNSDAYIGGPDRFLVGGISLQLKSEAILSKNISIQSSIDSRLYDTFDVIQAGSDSVLPRVRTDLLYYYNETSNFYLRRLQANYFKALSSSLYSKISVGYFEDMFAGYGGELLYRNFNSDWAFGVDLYQVKQREFDMRFSTRDYSTLTGHVTYYHKFLNIGALLKLSGGRYLAKDSGITIDLSKKFKSGVIIGAFMSKTDISNEEFGEGSFDKGIYFEAPLQIFSNNPRTDRTGFGLRPTTRDGAAKLFVGFGLWGVTDQGSSYNIIDNFEDIYE